MSLDAGEFALKKKSFDLDDFLQEVLDLIYLHANRKHIVINLEKSANVPKKVSSDPQRLQQILLHLLINAVKYTPQFKTITIKVTADALDPHNLVFQVADQGIGIPREKQIQLFKLFGGSEYLDEEQGTRKQGKPTSQLHSWVRTDHHQPALRAAREGVERYFDRERWDDLYFLSQIGVGVRVGVGLGLGV